MWNLNLNQVNFVFGLFFKQDHLLNLPFYGFMWKDNLNVMYFKTKAEDHSLRKKIWGWKNGSFVYAELNETLEAPTSIYSATGKFLRYIYSALVAKNYQIIRSSVLVYKFSLIDIFKIPFVMAEAS